MNQTGASPSGGTASQGGFHTDGTGNTGGRTNLGGQLMDGSATGGLPKDATVLGGTQTGGILSDALSTGGMVTGGHNGTGGGSRCTNADKTGAVNIDVATTYQQIDGFGGASIVGWIADLTTDQIAKAFGTAEGQIGMTILRIMVPTDATKFSAQVPTPKKVIPMGVKVMASPWTPPASMKSNNSQIAGMLNPSSYSAYADHLLSFRDYMAQNGAPLYAISVQNEPDIKVTYDSCDWTGEQLTTFVKAHGAKFGDTKLIVAESFNFNRALTDPLLNDAAAAAEVDIIGGHIYGGGLKDYPLARTMGKPVWMTEHYTESKNSANDWPLALDVGKELHHSMVANFSAYIWWYIRRSYGLLTEDGAVSKRGYLMGQFAKFIRPGFIRVAASAPNEANVLVTAYHKAGQVIVVAVNMNTSSQTITLNVRNTCVANFARYTTSNSKNLVVEAAVPLNENAATVTLDAQSVTTLVGDPG